jgi:hypothetical protein
MSNLPPLWRAPLLLLGFISLATGIAGGLARVAAGFPAPPMGIAWHGALMAGGFFGTLIALERAVAIGRLWAYAAPALSGAGGVALLLGAIGPAFALLVLGGAVLALASLLIYVRHRALHTGVMALGAACLPAASLWLAAQGALERAVPLWIAFFVLTIGGERLELSRLSPVPPWARHVFGTLCIALVLVAAVPSNALLGVLLLAIAAWLARFDLALKTVRGTGVTRYIAICLLSGYAWLAVAGVLAALGVAWDAALHAILLGFVFSMVFGHAPVILPAVLRIALPYRPVFYLPLALLHASVLARVLAPLAGEDLLRVAGVGNAAAIALFIVSAAGSAIAARKPQG